VIDSRLYATGAERRRRHLCLSCGGRYSTVERWVGEKPNDVRDTLDVAITLLRATRAGLPKYQEDDPEE
jgi:transcriptional regulator NrdR family protein